jgi:hypothetical protein
MVEANEIAKAARQLVRNTIDAVAVEALVRDRVEALERQLAEARAEAERWAAQALKEEECRIAWQAERDRLAADNARLRERENAAREFVKRHPALTLIDLAEFEAFLKIPETLDAFAGKE